jgi:hypothetical protein
MPSMKASLSSQARTGDGGPINEFSSVQRLGERRPVFPRRKSGPLRRISMLAQISSRASSLGEESRVIIGQTNSESQTDSTDESGSVCVSMGASHR